MASGRGQLSAIERLPSVCDGAIAYAHQALQDRNLTQTEIYEEFYRQLETVQREQRGEIEFTIPSFTAFNRLSIKLATTTRRMNDTREIAGAIAAKFNADDSDNLTLIAAEAIKTLVFELLTARGEAGMKASEALSLAVALRAATQAQGVSTKRRQSVNKEFNDGVAVAVAKVAQAKGWSQSTTDSILTEILGVPVIDGQVPQQALPDANGEGQAEGA